MRVVTILNQCHDFKSFRFQHTIFSKNRKSLLVEVRPRKNGRAICSQCGTKAPGYDTLPERLFEYVPAWGFHVYLKYAMRRVQCPKCGTVVVEKVPWCDGKHHLTFYCAKYLADWAKELAWQKVAKRFATSWQTVAAAVTWVVEYGLAHRRVDNVTAIGVDEVAWKAGHNYLTLVYQIDPGIRRLLWIGENRTQATMKAFFNEFEALHKGFAEKINVVCSDMWSAYLKIIQAKCANALNVLDKFHIMQKFNKAIDNTRAVEAKRLKQQKKDPVLSRSKWCFLKRRGNLTKKQKVKLNDLLKMNLVTVKAYLLREQFQKFWDYVSPTWAGKFLDGWMAMVNKSNIEPIKKLGKTLETHRELILNFFRAKKAFNSGIVEGLNRKINLTIRKSFGFRTIKIAKVAMYHQLGELPEPRFTHEFW